MGCDVPLLVLLWSTFARTVENATVSWSRVLVSVEPACPMEIATNSTRPQYCLSDATRGEYFLVFSVFFRSYPRSRKNPISMRMRVHVLLSKLVWSGSGVSGTHLAYIRSGAVPWPPSKRACASSASNTHAGIRLGAVVHSAS